MFLLLILVYPFKHVDALYRYTLVQYPVYLIAFLQIILPHTYFFLSFIMNYLCDTKLSVKIHLYTVCAHLLLQELEQDVTQ